MNSSARFSKIEEEREQLAVEIRYLQAKDAEFLKQQDSLVAELKKANEGISRERRQRRGIAPRGTSLSQKISQKISKGKSHSN